MSDQILQALECLSDELGKQGILGEICLFGGTAMVLGFSARLATKDVDAIFQPAGIIRKVADKIAAQLDLPANWLNDGVKGFVSTHHETTTGELPQFPNLRMTMPVPEYLLAMKCMAARIGGATAEDPSDVIDIVFLIQRIGLKSSEEVLDLVGRYYAAERIPVKTQYLVESLFEEGKI